MLKYVKILRQRRLDHWSKNLTWKWIWALSQVHEIMEGRFTRWQSLRCVSEIWCSAAQTSQPRFQQVQAEEDSYQVGQIFWQKCWLLRNCLQNQVAYHRDGNHCAFNVKRAAFFGTMVYVALHGQKIAGNSILNCSSILLTSEQSPSLISCLTNTKRMPQRSWPLLHLLQDFLRCPFHVSYSLIQEPSKNEMVIGNFWLQHAHH